MAVVSYLCDPTAYHTIIGGRESPPNIIDDRINDGPICDQVAALVKRKRFKKLLLSRIAAIVQEVRYAQDAVCNL